MKFKFNWACCILSGNSNPAFSLCICFLLRSDRKPIVNGFFLPWQGLGWQSTWPLILKLTTSCESLCILAENWRNKIRCWPANELTGLGQISTLTNRTVVGRCGDQWYTHEHLPKCFSHAPTPCKPNGLFTIVNCLWGFCFSTKFWVSSLNVIFTPLITLAVNINHIP